MNEYLAFLLRIWPASNSKKDVWRASLEDPHSRQILAFDSVESLCVYLRTLVSAPKSPDSPKDSVKPPPQDLPAR